MVFLCLLIVMGVVAGMTSFIAMVICGCFFFFFGGSRSLDISSMIVD